MTVAVESRSSVRSGRRPARTAVAVGLAVLASALLLWGRSYPGFPVAAALVAGACAVAALALAALARPHGPATALVAGLVAAVLAAGVVATTLAGDRPLRARWASSASDFASLVARLPPPRAFGPEDAGTFRPLPAGAPCPGKVGRLTVGGCSAVDGGYLFLQASDAVTDSSGIAYLPVGNDPTGTGLQPGDLTPLGGPWWAWTCHC